MKIVSFLVGAVIGVAFYYGIKAFVRWFMVWSGFRSECCYAKVWSWDWDRHFCTSCEKEVA